MNPHSFKSLETAKMKRTQTYNSFYDLQKVYSIYVPEKDQTCCDKLYQYLYYYSRRFAAYSRIKRGKGL